MKYFGYIIATLIMRAMAILPRPLLYLLSDILFIFIFYVFGYRRRTTDRNLRNAFPDYSTSQRRVLTRRFYHHLSDVMVENMVLRYYSRRRIERMFSFENPDLVDAYCSEGRHIILALSHYNNWEWASPLTYTFDNTLLAVYKPLKNIYFDRAYIRARTRFGGEAVPMKSIGRKLFKYDANQHPTLIGMVADQRPIWRHSRYWTNFLNQKTAIFTGTERLAKKFNAVVIFMKVRKIKRGKYRASFELITDTPALTNTYEITEKYAVLLESLILEDPAYWLWSHKRWKISYERWLELKESASATP